MSRRTLWLLTAITGRLPGRWRRSPAPDQVTPGALDRPRHHPGCRWQRSSPPGPLWW